MAAHHTTLILKFNQIVGTTGAFAPLEPPVNFSFKPAVLGLGTVRSTADVGECAAGGAELG